MAVRTRSSSQKRTTEVEKHTGDQTPTKRKPMLRGWFHGIIIPIFIYYAINLIQKSASNPAKYACFTYAAAVVLQATVSAIYNIPNWRPEMRLLLRKYDHAVIYILIAATYSPFCVVASEVYPRSTLVLWLMWILASFGMASCFIKKGAFKSKIVSSLSYILIGWCGAPPLAHGVFERIVYRYLLLGGISYSVGGMMYALHWPNPIRGILEYHEAFHLCTIVANLMMYKAILHLL